VARRGDPVPASATSAATQEAAVQQYLDDVIQDLDTTWTDFFTSSGLREPLVSIYYVAWTIVCRTLRWDRSGPASRCGFQQRLLLRH
jgi:hypothetical protein